MKTDLDERTTESLADVLKLIRGKLAPPQRAAVEDFTERYFHDVEPEDLAEREPADLYGAALSHWNFARKREPGHARIRVFNPTLEEHGWQSTHTIIEIVNDDMPFLVDSVTMEVNRHGLTLHLIIHPIMPVERDAAGTLRALAEPGDPAARPESFIHVEVDRIVESARLEALAADIASVLDDVRAAVGDWRAMRDRVHAILGEVEKRAPPLPADELAEGKEFLRWLAGNHFTFLGYRQHELATVGGEDVLRVVPESSLGILREGPSKEVAASFSALPPEVRAHARRPELLVVTKATSRSTVHRPGYLDYVAVKRFSDRGDVVGEDRFLGLFTSTAYSAMPADIPLLRRKVANVVKRAGLPPGGHAGKALINILDTYPRDELFQTNEDDLLRTAKAILHLEDRQRLRLFVRRDAFERFLSCLIYAPRENYTTGLREKWQAILTDAFDGTSSEFNVHLSESMLARIMITVRTTPGQIPDFDVREVEQRLVAAARRWEDDLRDALIATLGEARGNELFRLFGSAFPAGYREEFAARVAVPDIEMMARLSDAEPLAMSLYRPLEAAPGTLRFKLFRRGGPVTLSDSLPMIEHMGLKVLDERPYRITPEGLPPIWMHDLGMLSALADTEVEVDELHEVFDDAFARIFRGEVENDDFNRLVVAARLPADEIVVLRAYAKYLRQIGFALSQAFIEATLAAHADIAKLLVDLFKLRFDPALPDAAQTQALAKIQQIDDALDRVENLSEDRVLRQYLALILATTRTNFWRTDKEGRRRGFVSFKFDPARVPGLPEPKPMFEIFVYSTRFEGVHLRGGKVARGGLRWSDRPEDFRTEVLGLVKAQMVKNTVIVPVGSKGGFVLKRAPAAADRDAFLKEGVACYKDYLRGFLDLTDNRVGDSIVPPPQVKRHDADDPYLVVAADKGTATFSDYANAISEEYGFWLGDAFASGGSAGYDHKAMGITARGAWESVKRHFREMDIDIGKTPFNVVGVGDMSGDVFGNGMLREDTIRLLAAFDHRDIFIDPNPDPKASFAERKRMFALPRSSWQDYDKSLISKGGAVYSRSSKEIRLSAEARQLFGVEESVTPQELIKAILKAQVDLLFFGGIGTYIRASNETDESVGDRANDAIRITGADLNCKVIGEGANLGMTQRGRIEAAQGGVRLNTDAIDNSAGVNTSDVEVNIKIALSGPVRSGTLAMEARNALLAEMTDEVAQLVLRNNYQQTLALSLAQRRGLEDLGFQQRLMQTLEVSGELDRAVEFLPDEVAIAERRKRNMGLTRPELAVLLAYAKLSLYTELLDSSVPDDPYLGRELERYFPNEMSKRYPDALHAHRLRREIIATQLTNSMINRGGATLIVRIADQTGASPPAIAAAFAAVRNSYDLIELNSQIDGLDNKISGKVQLDLYGAVQDLLLDRLVWFLRNVDLTQGLEKIIGHYREGIAQVATVLDGVLSKSATNARDARVAELVNAGVPDALARRIGSLAVLKAAPDIALVADRAGKPVAEVAATYFATEAFFQLDRVTNAVPNIVVSDYFDRLALDRALDSIGDAERRLTAAMVGNGHAGAGAVEEWVRPRQAEVERIRSAIHEIAGSGLTLSKLSVAASLLGDLAKD